MVLTSCWYNHKWEDMHPTGQSSTPPPPCDTSGTISYSLTVQPILTQNCATTSSCHGSGASYDYTIFATVVSDAHATHGNDIMTRINLSSSNSLHMPGQSGGATLATCDVSKIRIWINQGCQAN